MSTPPGPPSIRRRGFLLVLSSPSGAGKTTITRHLLERDPTLSLSVSVTTRLRRPSEIDGKDYRFIDQASFDRMVSEGDLLEHATVFGHSYGTPRQPIESAIAEGRDIVTDIDAKQLHYPDARFSVVISNSIVHHIPTPLSALREAVRVLAPGGLIFFRDLARPSSVEVVDQLVQTYAGAENAHSQQMFRDSLHAALTLSEIQELVKELGFAADSVRDQLKNAGIQVEDTPAGPRWTVGETH